MRLPGRITMLRANPLSWLRVGPEYWYEKVVPSDSTSTHQSDDPERELYEFRLARLNQRWRYILIISAINAILFVLGASINLSLFLSLLAQSHSGGGGGAGLSRYSPITDTLKLKTHEATINGTLFPPSNPSFSRAAPHDPAAESTWAQLTRPLYFPLTRRDMMKIGKEADSAVTFPPSLFPNLPPDSYVGSLDSTHKLSCLNTLRKAAFSQFPPAAGEQYFSGSASDAEFQDIGGKMGEMGWVRLRQCVDLLAQDVMCHADAEVVTWNFRDMQAEPVVDASVVRKCRDWSAVMGWAEERAVSAQVFEGEVRYDGSPKTRLLENERGWYLMNGFEGSVKYPFGKGFDA